MSPTERPEQVREKKSFLSLLTDVPHLIVQLMRAELELLKAELVSKLKSIGIGLGLFVISLTLISLASLLFIFAGVFALSLVVPLWAAALIAGGGVLSRQGSLPARRASGQRSSERLSLTSTSAL